MSQAPPPDPAKHARVLRITAVAFLVLGLALSGFGVWFLRSASASSAWPTVEGKVISSGARQQTRTRRTDARTYYPYVKYTYQVGETEHRSARFSLGEGPNASRAVGESGRDEDAVATAAREHYPLGSTVIVYHDPADPTSAVLAPGPNIGTWVPLLIGLPCLAFGVTCLIIARRIPQTAPAS